MKINISRIKKTGILAWLVLVLFIHGNAILKSDDPRQGSQTSAISFDQKMEQEKDGVKGPATPKVIYYGGQGFLSKTAVAEAELEDTTNTKKKKKKSFSWSDWWEEKPSEPEEAIAETSTKEESFDSFWGDTAETPVNSSPDAGTTTSGDDWW